MMIVLWTTCGLRACSAGYKQCLDSILQAGEECDDGNQIPNDGCSSNCKLESSALFLCVNVTTFGPTECCTARINPFTTQQVCNCKTQVSDNAGYTISEDCR
jgi:cysteine-rich repeat protein